MKTTALVTALLASAALAAPALAGKADDTLNIAWSGELPTLDRYYNTLREGIPVARLIWDSLLFKDPATREYKPLLAKSYTVVDALTVDFDLREGITFHNGEPFDADDVVYTFTYAADPDNGVLTQRNVNWIDRVEKLGPYSVRLILKAPTPAMLEYLSGPLVIYPNEYYAEVGPEGMGRAPVGTGPYRVTEVEPGRSITFVKNDGYFEGSPKGQPSIGTIVQRTIPDQNTQLAELMSGRLDWIWKVSADMAERLARVPAVTVANEETMRVGYLMFDASNRTGNASPVNDVRVRRAISHAIDRQTIVDTLVRGASQVVHSACHPEQFGCAQDVTRYAYDPDKARALLAEAGYPDGFAIDFHAYRNRPYAEAMMGYLNAVGIRPNLVYLKYATLRDQVYAGQIDFTFMTWGSYSLHDVSAITSHFFKATKDDYARDDDVIGWLETGDTSVDPAERRDAYAQALQRIADQAYWLPLFTYNVNYAFTNDLTFTPTADEIPRFYLASWK